MLPAIVACGVSFAGMQFYVSNYMGPELTDILSSLTCIIVMVAVLKLWKPKTIMRLEGDKPVSERAEAALRPASCSWPGCPYLLLVVFVLAWGEPSIKAAINRFDGRPAARFLPREHRPLPNGLDGAGPAQPDHAHAAGHGRSRRPTRRSSRLNWLSASGTACLLAAILATALVLRVRPGAARQAPTSTTFKQLKIAMLTIASMLGLAYLMNYSGMTSTLGLALAATGGAFPFFSAVLGWLGVFLTGSDTSANALFGNLQVVTANALGLNPDPDGVGELGGRRDGQDDLGAEHRRGRGRHRHDAATTRAGCSASPSSTACC